MGPSDSMGEASRPFLELGVSLARRGLTGQAVRFKDNASADYCQLPWRNLAVTGPEPQHTPLPMPWRRQPPDYPERAAVSGPGESGVGKRLCRETLGPKSSLLLFQK